MRANATPAGLDWHECRRPSATLARARKFYSKRRQNISLSLDDDFLDLFTGLTDQRPKRENAHPSYLWHSSLFSQVWRLAHPIPFHCCTIAGNAKDAQAADPQRMQ
jgi:hypothetical protein